VNDDNRAWLRLARTENLGPSGVRRLVEQFGNPIAAVKAIETRAIGLKKPLQLADARKIDQEFRATQKIGGQIIGFDDPAYPPLLALIDDAPPVITVLGNIELLQRSMVAMVGARNASANGRRLTSLIANDLGTAGWVVASGLARGIDTAAHETTLKTGTIAVIAGGIDAIYPVENTALYHQIAAQGCIIAEGPLGQPPAANLFPRRNRIVAGLSYGVVVVEAALRSGSLVTASRALDQGREVFAAPGSPLDPRCRGSNRLLKDGATLVEGADDILCTLAPMIEDPGWRPPPRRIASPIITDLFTAPPAPVDANDNTPETVLRQALSMEPALVDDIVRLCALSPEHVMATLMEWELTGDIIRHPGNRVSLAG
jgi:DNA processing protein